MGRFVESLSDTKEVGMLEICKAPKFGDFSLAQWLGETPRRIVAELVFQAVPKAGNAFVVALSAEQHAVKFKL